MARRPLTRDTLTTSCRPSRRPLSSAPLTRPGAVHARLPWPFRSHAFGPSTLRLADRGPCQLSRCPPPARPLAVAHRGHRSAALPPGAADTILRQLEAFGLFWDGPVHWQHDRDDAYQAALARLEALGLAYPCSCSRKQWRDHPVYPGWCRAGPREPDKPLAWRLRSDLGPTPITWEDRLFGPQRFEPASLGDVVLKRKDGLWAYQLAVVVDDGEQGITDVVRGFDLLDNTPWQRQLQHALRCRRHATCICH